MNSEELKELMLKDKDQQWFTIEQLQNKFNIHNAELSKTLNNSGLFIRSSKKTSEGEYLFTTKVEFKQKTSPFRKIIGAFKNRID